MSLRILLRPSIYRTGAELYLVEEKGDQMRWAKPLTIDWGEWMDRDMVFQLGAPTLALSAGDVNTLKASIKEEAMRGGLMSDDHGAVEQMKTQTKHLDDMQTLTKNLAGTLQELALTLARKGAV